MIECLKQQWDLGSVRSSVAEALGYLGEHAAPAVPALRRCLRAREYFLRMAAAEALRAIRGSRAATRKKTAGKKNAKKATTLTTQKTLGKKIAKKATKKTLGKKKAKKATKDH